MADDIVDVLIIGAGASGAAVDWSLAETRVRIVCLEQGDWMNPAILWAAHFPRLHPSDFKVRTHRSNWWAVQGSNLRPPD